MVIAYDPRIGSKEFADEAARVLAAAGIPVYVFDGIRPTPLLSYAVRHVGAAGGIVITASHNPPEHNGYKVYGPDGGNSCRTMLTTSLPEPMLRCTTWIRRQPSRADTCARR